MQNAKVQGNTKLCIFAFNFSPVPILPRERLAYANIIWKANYFLESKLSFWEILLSGKNKNQKKTFMF